MNDLAEEILVKIKDATQPIWFPKLTPSLVTHKWQKLENIEPGSYTSDKVLSNTNASEFFMIEKVTGIPIYGISSRLLQDGLSARSYTLDEVRSNDVMECLALALDLISKVPSAMSTIRLLVKNIHLIKPEDDGFDISYSLPDVPFSIFISVPSIRTKNDTLRVAEAIMHEAMHLQLTLIDENFPLISYTSDVTFFSPWKNELRHPIGVLHAIYVFCAIRLFLETLNLQGAMDTHRWKRINEIDHQMNEIVDFKDFQEFTRLGHALVSRLL